MIRIGCTSWCGEVPSATCTPDACWRGARRGRAGGGSGGVRGTRGGARRGGGGPGRGWGGRRTLTVCEPRPSELEPLRVVDETPPPRADFNLIYIVNPAITM